MKPNPFWLLNHFTVPCVIRAFFLIARELHACSTALSRSLFESSFGEIISPTQSARRGQVVSAEARCVQYTRVFARRQGIPTRSRIAAQWKAKRLLKHAKLT